jgi:hypothetical protein
VQVNLGHRLAEQQIESIRLQATHRSLKTFVVQLKADFHHVAGLVS